MFTAKQIFWTDNPIFMPKSRFFYDSRFIVIFFILVTFSQFSHSRFGFITDFLSK